MRGRDRTDRWLGDWRHQAALIATVAAMIVSLSATAAPEISRGSKPALTGGVQVVDGDTLRIGSIRIRLFGIDAPERKQQCRRGVALWSCGEDAKRALERLIASREVTCQERDRDKYRRIVAVCYAGGMDLNREMVRAGWAVAYTRYSRDYVSDERAAKAGKLGIWSGEFELPETFRRNGGLY